MSIELKPFLYEAEVTLDDEFKLHLTMDYRVVNQLEGFFGRGMHELLGDLATSSSTMTQFLWAMTRKHHPDLSHDQIAGIQYSPKHGTAVATILGNIVRKAFNLGASKKKKVTDG